MMNPVDNKEESGDDGKKNKEPEVKVSNEAEETQDKKDLSVFPDAAVSGFLDNFKLELTHVSQEIASLTDEQNKLLEKVGEHNNVIQSSPDLSQLVKVMDDMKVGMERLTKLRHEMTVVHDRSEKLRSRAEKVESFCKTQQKKEEDLVAKMDKPSTASTTSNDQT